MTGPRRILVVNPNTSATVTDLLDRAARRLVPEGASVHTVAAGFGAESIETPAELAIAVHATLDAIARNLDCDAVVIAAFGDPALREARDLLSVPVHGMREAGLETAAANGRRFGIVTLGPAMVPSLQSAIRTAGFQDLLAGIELLDTGVLGLAHRAEAFDAVILAGVDALRERGAETVLLGGAPFSGLSARIAAGARVPVIDGLACALQRALAADALADPQAPRRSEAAGANSYPGLCEPLARLLRDARA